MSKTKPNILLARLKEGWPNLKTFVEKTGVPVSLETARLAIYQYHPISPHLLILLAKYLGFSASEIKQILLDSGDRHFADLIGESDYIAQPEMRFLELYRQISNKRLVLEYLEIVLRAESSEDVKVNRSSKEQMMSIKDDVLNIAKAARAASLILSRIDTAVKNRALCQMADALVAATAHLKTENLKDLEAAEKKGLSKAMIERLTLTDKAIATMAASLREVSQLSDPVGEVTKMWKRPNGLMVGKMRIPIGVIGIIYESRPNVTSDAAGLCLKSGNAVILRGGSEAIHSNMAIAGVLKGACTVSGVPEAAIQVMPMTDRDAVLEMLKLEEQIDLIIPRGGEGLIRFVVENSKIPVIKHYKGVCHVYVDESADLDMAVSIAYNAKVQRPGVCNSMETLLVHKKAASAFLPLIYKEYKTAGVELRGCPSTVAILKDVKAAVEGDWGAEYLDLILAVKVVESMDEAIGHIARYGSLHTESIVTKDYANAQRFLREVNSSTVAVNASTRFSDGFELGLGSEIGISTTKIHAFGPMGLEELTTQKFIIYGDGQVRG